MNDEENVDYVDNKKPTPYRSAGTIKVGKFDQKYNNIGNSSRNSIASISNYVELTGQKNIYDVEGIPDAGEEEF